MLRPDTTLLCVAEAWGFGPSAKLISILDAMPERPRVVLACTGTSRTYGEMNGEFVDDLLHLESPKDVVDVDVEFDAVLTVMDPWAALLGARRGVPTFYVDSLFWFWDWSNLDYSEAVHRAAQWVALADDDLRRELDAAIDWHRVVPMAYTWSSQVFVQRTPNAPERLAMFPQGLVEPVGAVVTRREPKPAQARGQLLISLAGATSHTTPLDVAQRYAEVVALAVEPLQERFAEVLVTGNPAVLGPFLRRGWSARELGARAMGEALAASVVAMAPAGLTTTLEAAAAATPLIFLPEQHGGHAPNRDLVAAHDPGAYDDLLLRRWFTLERTDPVGAIEELDSCYKRLLDPGGSDLLEALSQATVHALDTVLEPADRARRVERQRQCALAMVGDFDGARSVAEGVLGRLAEQGL